MRTQFIPNEENVQYDNVAESLEQAYSLMPWATVVIEVYGGYKGFELADEHKTWDNQK